MNNVNHIHCIARARVKEFFGPDDGDRLHAWLLSLVRMLGMNVMAGPLIHYTHRPELLGWSGVVLIETSSVQVHAFPDVEDGTWMLELDVYTCGQFNKWVLWTALLEFTLTSWSWKIFDRSTDDFPIIDAGAEACER